MFNDTIVGLAEHILAAASIREESFNLDTGQCDLDLATSAELAAERASHGLDTRIDGLVEILLHNAWNEAMDWANAQFRDEGGVQPYDEDDLNEMEADAIANAEANTQTYCQVWDGETQSYWPIRIDDEGKLWGFPDSSKDGLPADEMTFPKHVIWQQRVFKGDHIKITCPLLPFPVTGIAESVEFSSYDGEYYIEMTDDSGQYRYWKQDLDGGTVEKLEAK